MPASDGVDAATVDSSAAGDSRATFDFDLTLTPFVGLNAAPLVNPAPLPVVTGYGVSVALQTCCGTLIGSYRLHDETVSTSFDIRLGRVRE